MCRQRARHAGDESALTRSTTANKLQGRQQPDDATTIDAHRPSWLTALTEATAHTRRSRCRRARTANQTKHPPFLHTFMVACCSDALAVPSLRQRRTRARRGRPRRRATRLTIVCGAPTQGGQHCTVPRVRHPGHRRWRSNWRCAGRCSISLQTCFLHKQKSHGGHMK